MACLRERTGGKLATLTAVNLIVNVCSAKVSRCAVAISHISLATSMALPWRFQALCLSLGTGAVRKMHRILKNLAVGPLQLCKNLRQLTKIADI